MFFRFKKYYNFDKWKYFKYDYRKPRIKVLREVRNFMFLGIAFSILFSIFEKAALGHDSFFKNLFEAVYYFFTSITTIGYGDYSPKTTEGKLLFIGFICLYGVYKMVSIVELIFNAKNFKHELNKMGRLFMPFNSHIPVFFNASCFSKNNFLFLKRFIEESLSTELYKNNKIVLVNSNPEYSEALNKFLSINNHFEDRVHLINADIYEKDLLSKLEITKTKQIYIFASMDDEMVSDSKVYDTVTRIREAGQDTRDITIELIDDDSRNRLKNLNVKSIVRPNRSYPEIIVRAAVSSGSEVMIEELLSAKGDSVHTVKIDVENFNFGKALYQFSVKECGTLMGVIYKDGKIEQNISGNRNLENVDKLLMMVSENHEYYELKDDVNKILKSIQE